ncbi:MAG TPA: hypothetical protein PKY53_04480 [Clostridia bacterium]|jgi:hypothetical protein|nr:hypothetical protein [Clostridia bacterium]
MKKAARIISVFLIVAFIGMLFAGCNRKSDFYKKYFNDFVGQKPFTKAVSRINLDSGVSVFSYDSISDVFVTKKTAANQYSTGEDDKVITLYGFSSLDTQYVSPIFTRVLSIKGDYAIVTKPYVDTTKASIIEIVGVIKFRGENAGEKTDFTNLGCIFNPAYTQFSFVGDYIAVPGSKASPSVEVNYTTFYDYKTKDMLLETFKVGVGYKYSFAMYDNILIAIGQAMAYFFAPNDILQNGFLQVDDKNYYKAFPEDTKNEYADSISIQIFYIGNGWFVRSARIESEIPFTGYNVTYNKYDIGSGIGSVVYALVRTDIYNFNSKTATDHKWLLVDSVANKYTSDAYTYSADAINNLAVPENDRYAYYMPVLNPAKFIKDGYSIAYFYYTPYVEFEDYSYEISFCLLDENANIIRMNDVLMPLAFIDGIGVQNVDPTYQSIYGNLQYVTYDNKKVDLKEIQSGITYETYYAHSGIVIGAELNYADNATYFGAMDAKTKKTVLPFRYKELTPFYGSDAIGLLTYENAFTYVKVDTDGNETVLNDVVNVRQGVYVYTYGGKLGVKNYAGDVLINALYDKLEVYDVFMTDGAFQKSFAIATSGNYTYIFTLE